MSGGKIFSGLCETLFSCYFDFVFIPYCKTGNTINTCFPFSVNFSSLCQYPECFKEVLSDLLESLKLCILLNRSLRITVPRPISGDKEKEAKLSEGCFEGRLSLSVVNRILKPPPLLTLSICTINIGYSTCILLAASISLILFLQRRRDAATSTAASLQINIAKRNGLVRARDNKTSLRL